MFVKIGRPRNSLVRDRDDPWFSNIRNLLAKVSTLHNKPRLHPWTETMQLRLGKFRVAQCHSVAVWLHVHHGTVWFLIVFFLMMWQSAGNVASGFQYHVLSLCTRAISKQQRDAYEVIYVHTKWSMFIPLGRRCREVIVACSNTIRSLHFSLLTVCLGNCMVWLMLRWCSAQSRNLSRPSLTVLTRTW